MSQTYFEKVYKKRWRYRLIPYCILIIVAVGLAAAGIITYNTNLNNPTVVKTYEDYEKAVRNDSYVNISASKLLDMHVVLTETRTKFGVNIGKSDEAKYVAIALKPKIIIVSLPINKYDKLMQQKSAPYILKGKISNFSSKDLDFFRNWFIDNKVPAAQVDTLLCQTYLDYQTPMDSALTYIIIAVVLGIFMLVIILPVAYKNTSALKRLKKYSNGDLQSAYQQIDNEIEFPDVYKNGPVTITRNYIIVETQRITFAMPFNELMWAYKSTVQNRVNGIPTGKTNSLVLVFSDKSVYKVDFMKRKKEQIDIVLKYILEHNNKTFVGFSKEMEHAFKKDFSNFTYQWKNHDSNIDA